MFKLKNFLTVGFLTVLLTLVAFSISLWQTPHYKATAKLITVFNQDNIDTYTASKTANYITGVLGEVIYSDSFVNSVLKSEPNLINNLGNNSETRQKNWSKMVKVKILENKGVIIIDTYGDNKYQTNLLASAVAYTIINQHGLYDGSQDRVAIKIIDNPTIYEKWTATKIFRDTLIGFLAGLLLGFTLIVIFPNHRLFETSTKRKYNYQIPAETKTLHQTQTEKSNPLSNQTTPVQSISAPNTDRQEFSYNRTNPNKTQNPWLEKYYQDNPPEKLN